MNETIQEIPVSLTPDEWNVVAAGLMKLPGEVMFSVHAKIAQQFVQAQHAASVRAAEVAVEDPKPIPAPKKK